MRERTVRATKRAILENGKDWRIPLMEFVDDFRRTKDPCLIERPFSLGDEKTDSLLASTVEYLCDELGIETPEWTWEVPSCKEPFFVAGYENLKALSIAQSPVFFRRRKIFVLENFLWRV